MTRINCIPVQELTNEHLLAEYKELPRVFTLAFAAHEREHIPTHKLPQSYRMGSGHVMFFYDKIKWVRNRYIALIDELKLRGYNLNKEMYESILVDATFNCPSYLWNDWQVSENDMRINRSRIEERLSQRSSTG